MVGANNLSVSVIVCLSQSAQYLVAGFVLQSLIMHPEFRDNEFPGRVFPPSSPFLYHLSIAFVRMLERHVQHVQNLQFVFHHKSSGVPDCSSEAFGSIGQKRHTASTLNSGHGKKYLESRCGICCSHGLTKSSNFFGGVGRSCPSDSKDRMEAFSSQRDAKKIGKTSAKFSSILVDFSV